MPGNPAGTAPVGQASASHYSAAAQQLRKCARQLRALIPGYEAVLGPVMKLNNRQTWYGQYPDQVTSQINGWNADLRGPSKEALLKAAASWDQLASTYEQHAATAHAATVKAQHQAASHAGGGAK